MVDREGSTVIFKEENLSSSSCTASLWSSSSSSLSLSSSESSSHKPLAGSTTIRIDDPSQDPLYNGHLFAGWLEPNATDFLIRPKNYYYATATSSNTSKKSSDGKKKAKPTKKKISSAGSLYRCARVDIFESPQRIPHMASRVVLPKVEGDCGGGAWRAPDVFVVSIFIPTDAPSSKILNLKKETRESSRGYTITMYYTLRRETRAILQQLHDPCINEENEKNTEKNNAVRLWEEWCQKAPTDDDWMKRFKVLPKVQNMDEIGLPSWISKYNAKPFLIKRPGQTGFLYRDKGYMEFDITLEEFPYVAKQGIRMLREKFFAKTIMNFAFLIEGRTHDELPECLLGAMQVCYPDPNLAIHADDLFAGTSPSSSRNNKDNVVDDDVSSQ